MDTTKLNVASQLGRHAPPSLSDIRKALMNPPSAMEANMEKADLMQAFERVSRKSGISVNKLQHVLMNDDERRKLQTLESMAKRMNKNTFLLS